METFENTVFEIILLDHIKSVYLCCRDTRTVLKFLRLYDVPVFGSRRNRFVFAIQFNRALMQMRINGLKEKLGEKWIELFKEEVNKYNDVYLTIFDEIRNENHKPSDLVGKSEIEQKFLDEIHKTLKLSAPQ